jgi:hypothetical protein
VLSDHGQSQGATFRQRYGEELADVVSGDVREAAHSDRGPVIQRAASSDPATPTGHAGAHGGRQASRRAGTGGPEVSVMASGNLGWSPSRASRAGHARAARAAAPASSTRCATARDRVRARAPDGPVVRGPRGRRRLRDDSVEGEDPLAPFGPFAADHVRRTDGFAHCPDIVVNGHYWEELDEVAAFEELVGSHGGMGGGQAHPFVLRPADLPWPQEPVVGARNVHRSSAPGSSRSADAYKAIEPPGRAPRRASRVPARRPWPRTEPAARPAGPCAGSRREERPQWIGTRHAAD